MNDAHGHVRLVAILGTVSGLAALFWVVSLVDSNGSLVPNARPLELALALPVLALLVVAGATWFVLTRRIAPDEEPQAYVECGACGRSILEDWRLCPYCGSRVEPEQAPEGAPHAAS